MNAIQQRLDQGWAIHQRGDHRGAESVYRDVLRQFPQVAAAWCFLGIALHDQRRYADAERAYRQSLQLQPQFPIAWNNLGNTLRYLRRVDDAEQAFETALQQQPGYVNAWKNRGTLRVWEGNIEGALAAYAEAMRLAPQDAELHRNLGVIYLLLGDFQRGWQEYRWRWRTAGFVRSGPEATVWNSSDPAGKRILLYPEQGLGDMLHFVRMADEFKRRGATTIVQSPQKLLAILQQARGIDELIPQGLPLPPFDYHLSVIDAADRMGVDANSVPANVPYLRAAPRLVAYWKRWADTLPTGNFRVGIAWQGNPDHQADHVRSYPVERYAPIAALPGVTLVSLQQGFGSEQLDHCSFGAQVVRLPATVDQTGGAFQDTAAILEHLDLVLTSDTSIAHLAGALGRPVLLALATVPDWRWMLERDDSPWYPTMKLLRQTTAGDWDDVMRRAATEIAQRAAQSDHRAG